jgi:hypothetical protein
MHRRAGRFLYGTLPFAVLISSSAIHEFFLELNLIALNPAAVFSLRWSKAPAI